MEDKITIGRCATCTNWEKITNESFTENMGKCLLLSGTYGDEKNIYPEEDKTGILSYPVCYHDGAGFEYQTKGWFGCINYSENKLKIKRDSK